MKTLAKYITTITVIDPDTKGQVQLEIYKTEGGGMFGVDSSFLENTEEAVYSPFDKNVEIDSACLENMEVPSEDDIIRDFEAKHLDATEATTKMSNHFEKKHIKDIENATSIEQLTAIKEDLRKMPECAGKILLFRSIIVKEEKIQQGL